MSQIYSYTFNIINSGGFSKKFSYPMFDTNDNGWGRAVAQSVEHATPGEGVVGSTPPSPVAARSLLVGSVSV